MKRTVLFFALAFFAIALVSAQGNDRWGQGRGQGPRGHGFQQGKGFSDGKQRHHQRQQYSWNRGQQRNRLPAEAASVSGNLTIVQGMIAVKDNDITYLVRGLSRYIGFIDGLKEGAAVKLEGFAMSRPQDEKTKFMRVQKMTLNGKDYDLSRSQQQRQPKADGERSRGPGNNQRWGR